MHKITIKKHDNVYIRALSKVYFMFTGFVVIEKLFQDTAG